MLTRIGQPEGALPGQPVLAGLSRRFILRRLEDVHDFTGPGIVCWGVEFPDGTCAYRWNSRLATTVVAASAADVVAIHGHDGKTVLEWIDDGRSHPIAISNDQVHDAHDVLGGLT